MAKINDREKEHLVELPKMVDRRGNLSIVEAREHIPFDIKRVYWIYDVPGGQRRGSHAFRRQQEIIIALSGSFDVVLDDGSTKRKYTLNRSYTGLYVPNMMWRSLENFSTNSICLVIASADYCEEDYIRNYKTFCEIAKTLTAEGENGQLSPRKQRDTTFHYNTVYDCHTIEFPIVKNRAGNLTAVHNSANIPFDVERVFYIYDIPNGVKRGVHAHKHCHEILIATSGSFEVELDDGTNKRIVKLNRPTYGLHIPPGVWATQKEYSSGVVCLVLASDRYEEEDYISTYSEFKKYRQDENRGI